MAGVALIDGVPAVPPEGRFEGLSVPELIWDMHRARYTGGLLVERAGVRKVIYFREGCVAFAASTDPEDRLGHLLFRRGEVDLAPLIDAGGEVVRGRRLGQVLVERGLMPPDALVRAVLDHVREIVLSVFSWNDGTWRLTKACLPGDETITLEVSCEELILSGVRRVRDGGRVRRIVGGPRAVYRATGDAAHDLPGLGMTERAILEELRQARRVDHLCAEIFAPSEVVFRSLWALSILGLIERTSSAELPARPIDATGAVHDGVLDGPFAMTELLLSLAESRFTGALRLFHGGQEGALFLREGQVEFARTSDTEQSLAAHLLRRGVISDRDREQAVRRLQSGKRMGTLLAESGALDFQDLKRFVREQVFEVVKRLVLWTAGEYEIVDGDTVDESIVLAKTVEDVIMSAYESLDECERLWRELGDLSTSYHLRPEYLQRLDRMTLRPGIWEIVSLLGRPRTVQDILASRPEPDFEVCRWLCGLDRVRVIERVPEEDRTAAQPPWSAPVALAPETESAAPEADADEAPRAERPWVRPGSAADLAPELFAPSSEPSVPWSPELPEADPEPFEAAVIDAPAAEPRVDEPAIEPAIEPAVIEPAAIEPAAVEPAAIEPAVIEPVAIEPAAIEPAVNEPADDIAEDEPTGEVPPLSATPWTSVADPRPHYVPPVFESVPLDENEPTGAVVDGGCAAEPPGFAPAWPAPEPAELEPVANGPVANEPVEDAHAPLDQALYALDSEPPATVFPVPEPSAVEIAWPGVADPGPAAVADEDDAPEEIITEIPWPELPQPAAVVPAAAPEPTFEPEPQPEPTLVDREPQPEREPETAREPERESAAEPEPERQVIELPTLTLARPASAYETLLAFIRPPELRPGPPPPAVDPEPAAEPATAFAFAEPAPVPAPLPASAPAPVGAEPSERSAAEALHVLVARFNARHRIVFEGLRREIGAGVRNFIVTCERRLGAKSALFEGLAPDRNGVFDTEALTAALERWPGPAHEPLDALIAEELELVRNLLEPSRLDAIQRALDELR